MLQGCIGLVLQKATSPRLRNITNLLHTKNTNSNLNKMRCQRNMFQMKEQEKTPEELSEVEIGILPEKEFRVMIVKMIKELGIRMDA